MNYLLIALMWAGYCALHSYLISIRFTNLMKLRLKKYYSFYRLFYVLISTVLLVPVIYYTKQPDNQVIITYGLYLNICRYVLMAGSLIICSWAFFVDYDVLTFLGIRQILHINNSEEIQTVKELKRSGFLGIVRHPMYFTAIIFFWCQTQKLVDVVVNTVLTIYIIIGTMLEERKLILEFGDAYTKYQKEVPMLIPFTKF